MALLYRFTKLNDRLNTSIFTFIVTKSVTRDLHRDATTKDFYYGYHRWAISFSRANEKALGVYLILRNPSPNTECYADFSLTLLNREHFSRNEQFTEKACKFTPEKNTQGISKWILVSEIQSRKFADETGEFLLELSLGNITTIYKANVHIAPSCDSAIKSGKFESPSFGFGSFDWNVSIVVHNYGPPSVTGPAGSAANAGNGGPGGGGGSASGLQTSDNGYDLANGGGANSADPHSAGRIIYIFLNRLSGFDHPCRVKYKVIVGDNRHREESGALDQISDAGGRIRGWQMHGSLSELVLKDGSVPVIVELLCCNAISEAKVPIVRTPTPAINCYDRNKQGWCLESELEGSDFLRLKLYFMDLHSVPRNHLRHISWIAYVLARDPKTGVRESIAVTNSPHSNYYIQDGIDMGCMMDTTLPVAKVKAEPKVYLEGDNKLTVHVEWCDSILLFNHIYHKYDDISRNHCQQMRREIQALAAENATYEKQLLAKAPSGVQQLSSQSSGAGNATVSFNPTVHTNGRSTKSAGSTASSDSSDMTNHSGGRVSYGSSHHSSSTSHHGGGGHHQHHEPLSHRASSEQSEATSPATEMLVRHGSARTYSRSPVRSSSDRRAYMNGVNSASDRNYAVSGAVQYVSKLSISPRNSLDVPSSGDGKSGVCLTSPRAVSASAAVRASSSSGHFFSDTFPVSGQSQHYYNDEQSPNEMLVPPPVSPRFRRDRTPSTTVLPPQSSRLGPPSNTNPYYAHNQLSPFHAMGGYSQPQQQGPVFYDGVGGMGPPSPMMVGHAGNEWTNTVSFIAQPKVEYYD